MEKDKDFYEELMIRVLDGYATDEEQEQFNKWLKDKEANQQIFTDYKEIWEGAKDSKVLKELDIDQDLKKVKRQAKQPVEQQRAKVVSFYFLRKIAAILLPLAVIAAAIFMYTSETNSKDGILLSDGTKVWLYKDAKLDYPNQFAENNRLVSLTGEAYFEVAENAKKPFIISTKGADITVLGTSFNVTTSHTKTEVVVNTGKVRLSDRQNKEKAVELTKGERGTHQNGIVRETVNTDKNYQAWKTGIFEFDGTLPAEEVIWELSKYYGKIPINTVENIDCFPALSFEKDELKTVIETLKKACQ